MKQTVVGVFETSEEARRAQAALLDAQFEPSAVRVSAGGTLRGVDEGMAYPVGSIGAPDAPDLASRGPMPGETPHAHAMHSENALERLADFFRGLFSPESQREELARFEQALARGGALVAIDVNDDAERSLASDILVRSGACDIEERDVLATPTASASGVRDTASLEPSAGSVKVRPIRPAAMPGNVTSMDPSDPTGYRASRTDFATGATWPAARTALSSTETTSEGPVRQENLRQLADTDLGAASWDRLQGDFGVAGDYGMQTRDQSGDAASEPLEHKSAAYPADIRDRVDDPLHEALDEHITGSFGEERVQAPSMSAHPSPGAHMSPDPVPDLDTPIMRSHDLDRPGAASFDHPAARPHMASRDIGDMDMEPRAAEGDAVSGREARHLLASGCEVFLDDCGFARTRHGNRVQPMPDTGTQSAQGQMSGMQSGVQSGMQSGMPSTPQDEESRIARDVRVYSRRCDDPAERNEARSRDDSFSHSGAESLGERKAGALTGSAAALAARDRRMSNASLRARDFDDAREPDPYALETDVSPSMTPRSDDMSARDRSMLAGRPEDPEALSPDPATDDWALMASPGADELEAERIGDEAAERSAAQMHEAMWREAAGAGDFATHERETFATHARAGESMHARPTGAEDLARREAALREETLNEYAHMESRAMHPEWSTSVPDDPQARAAEFARREASMRDETLHDYAAMDERAEMRRANAAAAARAGHMVPEDLGQRYEGDDLIDDTFVHEPGVRHRSERRAAEWRNMKQKVRSAWHRMTHPGRHF